MKSGPWCGELMSSERRRSCVNHFWVSMGTVIGEKIFGHSPDEQSVLGHDLMYGERTTRLEHRPDQTASTERLE